MSKNIVPNPVMDKYTLNNSIIKDNHDGTITVNGITFTPADNSKVVHNTDMCKPASDVAGIEEVETVTAPFVYGAVHDGADLDNEKTAGTFFSINKVTNGPVFSNGDLFITWVVNAMSSTEATFCGLTRMENIYR